MHFGKRHVLALLLVVGGCGRKHSGDPGKKNGNPDAAAAALQGSWSIPCGPLSKGGSVGMSHAFTPSEVSLKVTGWSGACGEGHGTRVETKFSYAIGAATAVAGASSIDMHATSVFFTLLSESRVTQANG